MKPEEMPKGAQRLKKRMSDGGFYRFDNLHCKRYTLAILEMFGEAYPYWDQFDGCIKWCCNKPSSYTKNGLGIIS